MNNLSILNAKRIVIKIGSSLLFSNNKFNSKWLDTFIEDVILLRKKNIDILIVASGSVSLGKIYLNIEKKKTSNSRKASVRSLRTSNSYE